MSARYGPAVEWATERGGVGGGAARSPAPFDPVLAFWVIPRLSAPMLPQMETVTWVKNQCSILLRFPNTSLANFSSAGPSCCSEQFSLRCRLLSVCWAAHSSGLRLGSHRDSLLRRRPHLPGHDVLVPHTGTFPSSHSVPTKRDFVGVDA